VTASPEPSQPVEPVREPDLVDAIFEYLLRDHPTLADPQSVAELKAMVRERFGGQQTYIRSGDWIAVRQQERAHRVAQVLQLFNGRNASEIARRLKIGRATVYRVLKQARSDLVSRSPLT
jgi:Mor family transcriptional regulator